MKLRQVSDFYWQAASAANWRSASLYCWLIVIVWPDASVCLAVQSCGFNSGYSCVRVAIPAITCSTAPENLLKPLHSHLCLSGVLVRSSCVRSAHEKPNVFSYVRPSVHVLSCPSKVRSVRPLPSRPCTSVPSVNSAPSVYDFCYFMYV